MSMSRFMYHVHIADGFADDCDELIYRCSKVDTLTYDIFCDAWKEMNFGSIYEGRTMAAEIAELSEELLQIAKRYMIADTTNFEETVTGLFLVYGLLKLQPYNGFAALRLVPDDVPSIKRIEEVARRDRRLDVLYILGSILIEGPCQFHAEPREYGMEGGLRKYTEGCTGLDSRGVRPKGVFYRQTEELDMIRELKHLAKLYDEAKAEFKDEKGETDRNLKYTDIHFASNLDTSLKRIINGIIEDDDDVLADSNTVQEIKRRAMRNAVDPMKHLVSRATGEEEMTVSKNDKKSSPEAMKSPTSKQKASSGKRKASPGKRSPNKRSLNKRSPNKQSPKKQSPEKQSPKKQSPKKQSPEKQSPKKQSPEKQSPKKQSPKKQSPKKQSSKKKPKKFVSSESDDSDDFSVHSEDEVVTVGGRDSVVGRLLFDEDLNVKNFHQEGGENENDSEEEILDPDVDLDIDLLTVAKKSDRCQTIEIELIDHYKKGTSKANENDDGTAKSGELNNEELPSGSSEDPNITGECSSNSANMAIEESPEKLYDVDFKKPISNYRLKKLEKRDLKKPILKSKFKKMGMLPVANFEDFKDII